jgi:hypothetical protein
MLKSLTVLLPDRFFGFCRLFRAYLTKPDYLLTLLGIDDIKI